MRLQQALGLLADFAQLSVQTFHLCARDTGTRALEKGANESEGQASHALPFFIQLALGD